MLSTGILPRGFISTSEKLERIISRRVEAYLDDIKDQYLTIHAHPTLEQVKKELLDRGIPESTISYQICDFSETLVIQYEDCRFDFTRALFPSYKSKSVQLLIPRLKFWSTVDFSHEEIADFVLAIINWLPIYKMIVDNAEVELKKIELICQVGMTFLHSISERLRQKGINSYVTQNFDEETANMQIEYGNGISCKYKINLLDNFQEKILEITNRL
ncbi:MAG: hypothetical protein J6R30_05105 [Bacteroidales bacterium]|nr:hypothetical protein [Bacteroidales bacterium]